MESSDASIVDETADSPFSDEVCEKSTFLEEPNACSVDGASATLPKVVSEKATTVMDSGTVNKDKASDRVPAKSVVESAACLIETWFQAYELPIMPPYIEKLMQDTNGSPSKLTSSVKNKFLHAVFDSIAFYTLLVSIQILIELAVLMVVELDLILKVQVFYLM